MITFNTDLLLSGKGNYKKIGNGKPIVLLHGFAESYEIWNPIIGDLAAHYELIIPIIPYCGNENAYKQEFSMEQIANFVAQILTHEKIDRTILFGHSMGGYAAMAFAEMYAHKLTALSLVHSTAEADSDEKKQIRNAGIDFVNRNGKEAFFKTLVPKLYAESIIAPEIFDHHISMALQYSDAQMIACYKAMRDRPDRSHILQKINLPVQFIGGKLDQSVHYPTLFRQASLCRASQLALFENVGHISMHENPKLLAEVILNFCKVFS